MELSLNNKILFVLLGPTGVGKTELSLALAKELKTPIINADSRQIFKEIPIGTAAPTLDEQKQVEHFFVGSHSINDYYSAALYESDVIKTLNSIFSRSNVALLAGGSMMYIDAVCKGIDDIPTIREDIRQKYKVRLETEGLEQLLVELKRVDPEYYSIVDKKNYRRVVHALEICNQTGKTYTSFRTFSVSKRPFKIVKIGLNIPREELYERINKRILSMIDKGLIDEAKRMYPNKHLTSLNTVGYKELFKYFDGDYDYEEAIRRIQSNTRQYMRKQLTWFKKDTEITWFNPSQKQDILNYIYQFL